ncbi:hypothetical protein SNARM312S_03154 [Streptomyces narbonensis]
MNPVDVEERLAGTPLRPSDQQVVGVLPAT